MKLVQRNFYNKENKNVFMFNSINIKSLPVKDLVISGLIIFVMSTIIANIYDPFWGFIYSFSNILTLVFLSWLYQDSWNTKK